MTSKIFRFALSIPISILTVSATFGSTDFGSPQALTSLAATDSGDDQEVEVVPGSGGTWIAVWRSRENSIGIPASQAAAVFSRSTDNAVTWTNPQLLRPEVSSSGMPTIATNGSGRWVAAWEAGDAMYTSISTDDGVTWGTPVTILAAGDGFQLYPSIATDAAGTWVLVWQSTGLLGGATGGNDDDILFSRSIDNGATWSPVSMLNSDGGAGYQGYGNPSIVTDGSGNWVTVWETTAEAWSARSTDNGATWSAPVRLSPASPELYGGTGPHIATDGAGRWIAVFRLHFPTRNRAIAYTISTDNGSNWTPAAALHPYFAEHGGHNDARISYQGSGAWQVVWDSGDTLGSTISDDGDILTSYSRDNGLSWSSPAALLSSAQRDRGLDGIVSIARSAAGRTVVAWSGYDGLNGQLGEDEDILFARADDDCPNLPRVDCLATTRVGGSRIKLIDDDEGKDSLVWQLKRAQETMEADLGNPTTTDSFALCLYELRDGSSGLIAEWDIRAGEMCGSAPCWTQDVGQIRFKDSKQVHGATKKLSVKSGADGDASVRVSVKGPALAPPRLPLLATTPVRIQLVNLSTDVCWEGLHDQAEINDDTRFESTSD